MKMLFVFGLLVLMDGAARSQGNMQNCGWQKKSRMSKINMGPSLDAGDIKMISVIDKEWQTCVEGKLIPHIKERTLANEKIDAGSLAGKVLVINFWFATCAPCVAEMPALNKIVGEYKNEPVRFISFTHDDKWTVKQFLQEHPFDFDIVTDASFTNEEFGVSAFPTTFVVDQQSRIVKVLTGGSIGEPALNQAYERIKPLLDQLLKAGIH